MAETGLGALVGLSAQGARTFPDHGLVDQEADALGEAFGTLFGEELHDGVQEFKLFRVGHG